MRRVICLAAISVAFSSPAFAQMSITTIGATDAVRCYENARNDFSGDTEPCDIALKDNGLNRADRKRTLVNRGVIHNRNGDLSAAFDDFNAALDLDGALGEAYLNRGNAYYMSKQYDSALADYQRSLDLGLNKPWAAWYNIGLVYEAQNNPEKAREAYEAAAAANPNFSQAQQKLEGKG
ncbi:MAG: tetratricopeptide repeat protein [Parvularculaceae bacterium]